ncbi:hypothetical protein KFK09_028763 [Dendrobium nobile]|uniref:Wall-associated receptor kinase C-terminal domain-containing protein n=1 Tax=Dendrobium nobile TaxID=94219 RepID=A0A8T3A2U3_DENNO|nr:hypothetical protein KFK09_028763 [Dendrobium nobile]
MLQSLWYPSSLCYFLLLLPLLLRPSASVPTKEDFNATLKGGSGLTRNGSLDWCLKCVDSGGRCGYDETRPEDQICFCSDTISLGSCFNSTNKRNKGIVIGEQNNILTSFTCSILIC